jgi:hypothetical protein
VQVLSSMQALLDETPLVVMPSFGGSSSEAIEVAALERHISSYAILLQQAVDAGVGVDTGVAKGT